MIKPLDINPINRLYGKLGFIAPPNANAVATPKITRDGNDITITCATTGATIKYSTDGGENWSTYSSTVTILEDTAFTLKAEKSGMEDSRIVTYNVEAFIVEITAVLDKVYGTITATADPEDATIYYTDNGDTPTSSATEYTEPFTPTSGKTYKFIGILDGYVDSEVVSVIVS